MNVNLREPATIFILEDGRDEYKVGIEATNRNHCVDAVHEPATCTNQKLQLHLVCRPRSA